MKNAIVAGTIAIALATSGCGTTAQQIATVVVDVSNDVCTLISQNDPTAPTAVQVVCKVEGQVAPVVVNLPWSAWQAMVAGGKTVPAMKVKPAVKH